MPHGRDGQTSTEPEGALPRTTILIFAAAAGLSVANIYYAQPLLDAMAQEFGISPAAIGLVVTLTQVGYGLGLIFIVPLGDLIDRRRLILGQGLLSVLALVAVATAETGAILFAGMAAVGLLAVVVQVLVAFAATLATPTERGRVVGTVTSGIVIGILAARFAAGILADIGGWRAVYLVSRDPVARPSSACSCASCHGIGSRPEPAAMSPPLRSVPILFLSEPVLLVRGVLALLIFASFSTFWTALVLPLSAPPFSYSHTWIGLFGLVGLAGAMAATGAGRLADRGHGQWTTGATLVLLLVSWAPIALLPVSIPALIFGVVLLDLAVQAVHVTNQSLIVSLRPEASSRLIGSYMVFYSVGSAPGAAAATSIYARAGWPGVSALGATFSTAALLVWLFTLRAVRTCRT